MPAMDEISARLTVLETVLRQLITHMAIRAEDPPEWVRTRRVLAARALDASGHLPMRQAALLRDAMSVVFDQAELVAHEYATREMSAGTTNAVMR